MTVLNEVQSLPVFLRSLGLQRSLPRELVVVDGGSDDGTVRLLEGWDAPPGLEVNVILSKGANISQGRNLAIESAAYDVVAITDAGTTLHPGWLEFLTNEIDRGADVASGFFVAEGTTFLGKIIAAAITPDASEIDPLVFLPSSRSVAMRKAVWSDAGGYPTWLDYCEDLVFDLAAKQSGAHFVFVPGALVTWDGRPTMRAYAKQYYRYARGDGKAGLWAKRHIARYTAYLVGLFLSLTALRNPWIVVPLAAGFAGYTYKFFKRTYRASSSSRKFRVAAIGLTPTIVIVGDVAKMVGYPVGVIWRRRHRKVISDVPSA